MNKVLVSVALALLLPPVSAQTSANDLISCMRANVPAKLRAQAFELVSTGRSGSSRSLKGKLYAMDEQGLMRLTMRVLDPADIAGSAYLLRESGTREQDHIYVFLPALNRVRRITGGEAGQSLFGTDFSYSDFKQIQVGITDGESLLEAPTSLDARPVQVLAQKPKAEHGSPYTMTRSWVDQETCVILKADFYQGTVLRKQLTSSPTALARAGKYWYLAEMEMSDLKASTKTRLKVQIAEGEKELSQFYFNPNTFSVISR